MNSCAHAYFELACFSFQCVILSNKSSPLAVALFYNPMTHGYTFSLKDTMARRPADPEEELRWMSQEVRGYVEAVLNSLAANVPKVYLSLSFILTLSNVAFIILCMIN